MWKQQTLQSNRDRGGRHHAAQEHNPESVARHCGCLGRRDCVVSLLHLLRSRRFRATATRKQSTANDKPPSLLNGVGIAQHLNQQLPLNLTFTDDAGKQVTLGSYFGKQPAILALVYYHCPMLCSEELDGLTSALQMVRYVPGKDFNMIVVSIDPTEGTDLAAAKKRSYVKRYGHPETANGWHFLTGTQPNIDALTQGGRLRLRARFPAPTAS